MLGENPSQFGEEHPNTSMDFLVWHMVLQGMMLQS